jgi:anti-sigma factor RsiW
MNCKRIKKKLDLLAGDDLSGRDAAEVEAHLRQCLSCYREYVDLREMLVAVRGASRPAEFARSGAESEAFVGDVMKQIQGPPPALPRLMLRVAMVSGWAAALVLGLTVGWYRWQLGQGDATHREPAEIWESRSLLSTPAVNQRELDQRIDSEVQSQLDELRGQPNAKTPRRGDALQPSKRWPPKSY